MPDQPMTIEEARLFGDLVLTGCVSGDINNWPQFKPAIRTLLAHAKARDEEMDQERTNDTTEAEQSLRIVQLESRVKRMAQVMKKARLVVLFYRNIQDREGRTGVANAANRILVNIDAALKETQP